MTGPQRIFWHTDPDGASVPGTGDETPGLEGTGSSAGTLNTDTPASGGPPETIPYSRFKEVNDQLAELRDFRPLVQTGYDADSLRQLAEFDTVFKADPVTTWLAIAAQIDDLPTELKEGIQQHLNEAGSTTGGSVETKPRDMGAPTGDEMPQYVQDMKKELEEVKSKLSAREQTEVEQANQQALDGILSRWETVDQEAQIKSPARNRMLTYIIGASQGGGTPEQILERARTEWLEVREEAISSVVKPGNGGSPLSVPGSGAPANTADAPKTLADASKQAKAFLESQQRDTARGVPA